MTRARVVLMLLGLALFGAGAVFFRSAQNAPAPEIRAIMATSSLPAQTILYRSLLQRVGLSEAQEDLYRSGLPFDGESHLLNHESGEFAYEKYGSAGIAYCKDYFLGSCYHGAVLETIAHDGTAGLAQISACWKADETVRIQCAHGIGHGLLAWVGYKNLPQALTLCDQLAQTVPGFPAFNCHDGVFMENIWAVHDNGIPSKDRWVEAKDLQYPCDDPRINEAWEAGCWANQPSLAYQLTGGNLPAVSRVCESVSNGSNQRQCFEGLARQIHPLTHGNAAEAARLCDELSPDWSGFCLITIAYTDYAVGGRELPFQICENLPAVSQENCAAALADAKRRYGR